jgi:ubiquinol-cytochrome c reductase cytochrome c subunit
VPADRSPQDAADRPKRLRHVALWWGPILVLTAVGAFLIAPPGPRAARASTPGVHAAGGPSSRKGHFPAGDPQLIFQENCASCHGENAQGTARAPSLRGVGAAGVDFMLRSGLMPLKEYGPAMPTDEPYFSNAVIQSLDKYVPSLAGGGGPAIPNIDASAGSVARGGTVFREYCAACHSWAGAGGVLSDRAIPDLFGADNRVIADAVRFGPAPMPRFGSSIDRSDLDSIAAYLDYMKHPYNRGGDPLSYFGPVASGFVGLAIGLVLLVGLIRWIGQRG